MVADGDVLALSIFQIGKPESGLVIERLDTRYELDFAMVVGIQPGNREMPAGADDQLVGSLGVRRPPHHNRLAVRSLLADGINERGTAFVAQRRMIASIARPDGAFRGLQTDSRTFDRAGDLIERNTSPLQE